MCVSAGGQMMPPCLAWGRSSSETPEPTGHVDGEDKLFSGHLCGLMTEDQVLTPTPGLGIVFDSELWHNWGYGIEGRNRRGPEN